MCKRQRLDILILMMGLLILTTGSCGRANQRLVSADCPAVLDRADPCPIHRAPPRYPAGALDKGGEAMVLVEYDVLENGHTDAIEIAAAIGNEIFEQAAMRAVATWIYAPAVREGVAVRTRDKRVSIPFRIHVRRVGATPEAKEDLVAVFDAIGRADLDAAKGALTKIEAWDWPNLYEDQYRSLVRGIISFLDGRDAQALSDLSHAMIYDGKYIGENGRFRALVWTIRAAHREAEYGKAYRALHALNRESQERTLPGDLQPIQLDVMRRRNIRQPIRREFVIPPPETQSRSAAIRYTPFRPIVLLESIGDEFPERLRISCDDHSESLETRPGMRIEIAAEWTDCILEVYGTPGTPVAFVEPPIH